MSNFGLSSFAGGGLNAGTAFIDIRPRLDNFGATLQTQMQGVMRSIGQISGDQLGQSLQKVGASTAVLGKTLTKSISLPIAAAGVISTKFFSDFELALSRSVGLAGVAESEIGGITDAVFALSRETGRGPTELAEALYFIRSSGADAATAMEILEVSAKGATAGLGNAQTVAKGLTFALNAYEKQGLTAARAGDILAATVTQGAAEANELAEALGFVAPLAAELGLSFEQLGATFAAQTVVGVDTSTVAVNTTQILTSLLKTTPAAAEALAEVHLNADELRATLGEEGGLLQVMRKVDAAFGDNEEALNRAFPNIRALRGVMALLAQNGEQVDEVFREVADSAGDLELAFGAAADTTSTRLAQSWASIQVGLISLGETFAPIAESISGFFADMAIAITKIPAPLRTAGVAMATFAAAAGPIAFLGGKITKAVGSLLTLKSARRAVDDFRLGLMGATQVGASFSNRLGIIGAQSAVARVAITGLAGAVGAVAVAIPAMLAIDSVFDSLGGRAPDIDRVGTALLKFGETGLLDGVLADALGENAEKLGELVFQAQKAEGTLDGVGRSVEKIGDVLVDPFGQGATEFKDAAATVDAIDKALTALFEESPEGALLAQQISQSIVALGPKGGELVMMFDDFSNAFEDATIAGDAAAGSIDGVGNAAASALTPIGELVDELFANEAAYQSVVGALIQAESAQQALSDAQADAAGTGPRATAAAQRQREAMRAVAQAADDAAEANERLLDARRELTDFEVGEAAAIRDLELMQLRRRRVTSSEDALEKEIALREHNLDTIEERNRLQDRVEDAEDGVRDAADRVADAQGRASDAAEERRKVQTEAAGEIELAELGVEAAAIKVAEAIGEAGSTQNLEAIDGLIGRFKALTDALAPGSELRLNLEYILAMTLLTLEAGTAAGVIPGARAAPQGPPTPEGIPRFGPPIEAPPSGPIGPPTPEGIPRFGPPLGEHAPVGIQQVNHFDGGMTEADLALANEMLGRKVADVLGRR